MIKYNTANFKNKKNKNAFFLPRLFLFAIIIFSILLTSCSNFTGNSNIEKSIKDTYLTGTSGIELKFIENNPSKEIYSDSFFSIGIEVKNKGAYDIENGLLVLNSDLSYIEFKSNPKQTVSLLGKGPISPNGEERTYFFNAQSKKLIQNSVSSELPILVSLCYTYQTIFEDVICIDKSYSQSIEKGEAVCKYKDLSSSGQGGPVAITKVQLNIIDSEISGLVKPIFDIVISHKGSGAVTNLDSYGSFCSNSKTNGNLETIKLKEVLLSGNALNCNLPEDSLIKLKDGSAKIRCESKDDVNAFLLPYIAPLSIVLDYGYIETKSKTITIIKS